MSNDKAGNAFERLFKLWSAISKMVVDGTRDPYKVAEVFQSIVDGQTWERVYLNLLFETSDALVFKQIDGGSYTEIFGSLGKKRSKWLDVRQVDEWCRQNLDKLQRGEIDNLFELNDGRRVVAVRLYDQDRFRMSIYWFSTSGSWDATRSCRVAVPKSVA